MAQSPTVSTPTAEDVYKIHVIGNTGIFVCFARLWSQSSCWKDSHHQPIRQG